MGGQIAGEARLAQQARIEGGDAHQHIGLRHQPHQFLHVEFGQQDDRRSRRDGDVGSHEQPMRVEDRQGMQQPVIRGIAPVFAQGLRIGSQIALTEHRPLRTPRGARCIQDGGQIVILHAMDRAVGGLLIGQIGQLTAALRIEHQPGRHTDLGAKVSHRSLVLGPVDQQGGLGIAQEKRNSPAV
jgi:hypothetical protein